MLDDPVAITDLLSPHARQTPSPTNRPKGNQAKPATGGPAESVHPQVLIVSPPAAPTLHAEDVGAAANQ